MTAVGLLLFRRVSLPAGATGNTVLLSVSPVAVAVFFFNRRLPSTLETAGVDAFEAIHTPLFVSQNAERSRPT